MIITRMSRLNLEQTHKVTFVVVNGLSSTSSAILGWDWIQPNLKAMYPNRIVIKSKPFAQISLIQNIRKSTAQVETQAKKQGQHLIYLENDTFFMPAECKLVKAYTNIYNKEVYVEQGNENGMVTFAAVYLTDERGRSTLDLKFECIDLI